MSKLIKASLLVIIQMNYSYEELIDMIDVLGESERNSNFMHSDSWQKSTEAGNLRKYKVDGLSEQKVLNMKERAEKAITGEDKTFMVLANVVEHPHTSTTKISRQFDVSQI